MTDLVLQPDVWIWLPLVAFAAGFIDAIAGGGGLLTVPALLTAGLPPHLALGTNKLAATFGSSTASWTFFKKRLFDPQLWKTAAIGTLLGALFGALTVDWLKAAWLEKALPIAIFGAALYTLLMPKVEAGRRHQPQGSRLKLKQGIQGFTLGTYDGVFGPGTGAFWTVSTLAIFKLDILHASGVARTMNFLSNFTSLLTFAILGHIHWGLGLAMGSALMVGAYLGAHSAIRFGGRFIRPIFISVVLIMAAKLAWEAW
ncbi:TSUP family transporter [Gallaecimonas kandeliae]|uniref:TSUP family transporter n=1 Tax=Gallaecimonas kandeliae TaxID=3029055 RepID=UPI002648280B|nr:TSUP family transporter [Gallaecimonas kandeliae]WKE64456.1 TSUP family transporter [Gallaecimonas kandeliae]